MRFKSGQNIYKKIRISNCQNIYRPPSTSSFLGETILDSYFQHTFLFGPDLDWLILKTLVVHVTFLTLIVVDKKVGSPLHLVGFLKTALSPNYNSHSQAGLARFGLVLAFAQCICGSLGFQTQYFCVFSCDWLCGELAGFLLLTRGLIFQQIHC